jgi:hypothetical protein
MKVVWSDEAVFALVALEVKLAERYSAERAAELSRRWFDESQT